MYLNVVYVYDTQRDSKVFTISRDISHLSPWASTFLVEKNPLVAHHPEHNTAQVPLAMYVFGGAT